MRLNGEFVDLSCSGADNTAVPQGVDKSQPVSDGKGETAAQNHAQRCARASTGAIWAAGAETTNRCV